MASETRRATESVIICSRTFQPRGRLTANSGSKRVRHTFKLEHYRSAWLAPMRSFNFSGPGQLQAFTTGRLPAN